MASSDREENHHHHQIIGSSGNGAGGGGGGRRVLIAMDGSEHSFFAFDWFMRFFYTEEMEVIVAHSGPTNHTSHFQMPMMSSDPAMIGRIIQMHEDEVNTIASKIKDKFCQHGIRGRLLRLRGDPGQEIVRAAEAHAVTCIVTGSRGMGTIRRTLLGSVSDYILHHAHVPVLVCRHKDQPEPDPKGGSPLPVPHNAKGAPPSPHIKGGSPSPHAKSGSSPSPHSKGGSSPSPHHAHSKGGASPSPHLPHPSPGKAAAVAGGERKKEETTPKKER